MEEIKEIQEKQVALTLQKNLLRDKILEAKRLISAIEDMEMAIYQQSHIPWDNMFDVVKYTKHASVEQGMMHYYDQRA